MAALALKEGVQGFQKDSFEGFFHRILDGLVLCYNGLAVFCA